jgi:hypothetical protein
MTECESRSRNPRIEIVPVWIVLFDKLDLPGAFPVFQSLFAEDRLLDVIELFEVNQPMNPIPLRESINEPLDPVALFSTHQHFTEFAASSIFLDDATEPGTTHP